MKVRTAVNDRVVEKASVTFGITEVPSHKNYPNRPWWRDKYDGSLVMLGYKGNGATSISHPFDFIVAFYLWCRYRLPVEYRLSKARRRCINEGHLLREKSWGNGYVERGCIRCEADFGWFSSDGRHVVDWCAEGHTMNTISERRGDEAYCSHCNQLLYALPPECGALNPMGGHCTAPKNHVGPHGIWMGNGVVLAPWGEELRIN